MVFDFGGASLFKSGPLSLLDVRQHELDPQRWLVCPDSCQLDMDVRRVLERIADGTIDVSPVQVI